MSGRYTQQELLLLSNFVYIPVCLSDGTIEEIIGTYRDENGNFTEESVAAAAAGGGMSTQDICTVFTEMDKRIEENPDFGQLSVARSLEEADVRAVCYTDPKDASPVVAFRGTGGTRQAWTDNFEGAFTEDTRIQKTAADFIGCECAIYEDIVVTGHSKGGNLAQYVTVRHNDRIKECVSYDGQGFGDAFIEGDPDMVKAASPKITSISAYNDFVNILLTCIAGTCIYVENDPTAAAAHSPVTLITKNTFDKDGNFTSVRDQGTVSKQLSRLTDRMCDMLSGANERDKESMAVITGSAISLALTTPPDDLPEGCIAPVAGLVAAKLAAKVAECADKITGEEALVSGSVYINACAVNAAAAQMEEAGSIIAGMMGTIDEVRSDLAYTMTSGLFAEGALGGACEDLRSISSALKDHALLIRQVVSRYEECETETFSLMNG